ncbi:PAS domain S-box protein [Sphingobium sp. 3R8]|uniref:PAS domain-containing sensor histidine kinase n=1 Tax=Sphingobium sp. 3R8 TaxID=2874921 RepID=UPI001CCF2FB8|nr:PAS domain S-box protein [Sphingobium sp. 3R8]MBZ9649238.1 PAS domain S-box protein [Sphingobium sp. 3R8]
MLRLTSVQLFDHMSDGVLVLERDWSISYCNARAEAAFGGRDLKGQMLWDVFPHARGTGVENVYRRAFQTGQSEACEFYSHDLSTWFEVHAIPVKEELAILFRDISKKRVELERVDARRRALDALFDQVFLGIMQVDAGLRPMLVNDHLCTLAGRSRHELLTSSPFTWMAPEDAALFSHFLAASDAAPTWEATVRLIRPDGTLRHCALQLSRVMEGKVHSHSIIVLNDVTEQLEAERNSADTAALLRAIIDSAQDLIFVKDRDGRFVLTNRELTDLAPPLIGGTVEKHFAPHLAESYAATDAEVMQSGRPAIVEERIPLNSGERMFQTIKVPWRSGDETLGVIGISRDITERLSAEARLCEQEERYRLAARATKDAIWDWDLVSGQVTWNPAIEDLCGDQPSPDAAWWRDRIHPEDRGSVQESIEEFRKSESERWEHEYRFRRADGSYAHILDRGFLVRNEAGEPVRMIGAMVDMSERAEAYRRLNELQSELIHVSRVSAMGTMASALAHELNQPLTGIANYVSGARRLLQEKGANAIEVVLPVLADAADEVIKTSELIRRLRRMVARGQVEVQTIELDALITDALSLAIPNRRLAGVEIEISVTGASILCDPIQVQQVLVNLIRNAAEAMEGRPVKRLELWSERLDGVYRLYVRDTGMGIPLGVAERLFTPFTTTKPDGLGVGLMISRTILEAHGGAISLMETGPQGTTMFIDLPAS